jgi:hypothetical protein|tara:strand:+ start:1040 stop:1489 length:450 start_codon:yes stop_codon:yes gene_type:complete
MYIKYVLFFMATIIIGPAFSQQASKNENIVSDKVKEIEIDANAPPLTEAGCFSIRGIHNFSSLHDQYLYVEGRGNSHYILTMDRRCLGLRNAREIAIENHRDRVCSNSQARVSYRGVGGRMDTCGIRIIEKLEDKNAARTLMEIRTLGK